MTLKNGGWCQANQFYLQIGNSVRVATSALLWILCRQRQVAIADSPRIISFWWRMWMRTNIHAWLHDLDWYPLHRNPTHIKPLKKKRHSASALTILGSAFQNSELNQLDKLALLSKCCVYGVDFVLSTCDFAWDFDNLFCQLVKLSFCNSSLTWFISW